MDNGSVVGVKRTFRGPEVECRKVALGRAVGCGTLNDGFYGEDMNVNNILIIIETE